MDEWNISTVEKIPKLTNPVFIEGLPGIGNVGKVAVDFMIDELKAKKAYEIVSPHFPHSVFVNEDSLVELPIIEVFYKKKTKGMKNDLIILAGDVQPVSEKSTYQFSDAMLQLAKKHKAKEVLTLGGIGLNSIPKNPKVYLTGNEPAIVKKYKAKNVSTDLYGVVGPIVGVSGLLVGLASLYKMKGASLLAETYGHPMYLGIKGAQEILKVLDTKLSLGLKVKKLEKEIKEIESEVVKKEGGEVAQAGAVKQGEEVNYIG